MAVLDAGSGEGSRPHASRAAGSEVFTQRSASTSLPSTQLCALPLSFPASTFNHNLSLYCF